MSKKITIYAGDTLSYPFPGGKMEWKVLRRYGNQESMFMLTTVTSLGETMMHPTKVAAVLLAVAQGELIHHRMGA